MAATVSITGGGSLTGTLEIPAGSVIGAKEIEITGSNGTICKGYISDGTAIPPKERQALKSSVDFDYGPQGQTFYVPESRLCGGIDIKLVTKDAAVHDIVLQLREVSNGQITSNVLAESRKAHAALIEGVNQFTFDPVYLFEKTEYAFCIFTDSIVHALAVAEVGGIDIGGDAVTKQSYQQGINKSSANGNSWTDHPTRDLWFRILACNFTSNSVEIDLGDTTSLTNITDLAVLAGYEQPTRDSKIKFKVTAPDTTVYLLDKDQVLTLATAQTGIFNLKAVLEGNSKESPILFSDSQLLAGVVQTTGTYNSRLVPSPSMVDITLKLEGKLLNSGTIAVYAIHDNGGGSEVETLMTLQGGTRTTPDGWEYRIYTVDNIAARTESGIVGIRFKVVLGGSIANRAYVRALGASIRVG
jgi:hypothetical protein